MPIPFVTKPTVAEIARSSYKHHSRYQGIEAHWVMAGPTGDTVYDISGNGNDVTLTNMSPSADWVPGPFHGRAIDWDGVDDRLSISGASFDGSGDISFSVWMKPRSFGESNFGRIIENTGNVIWYLTSASGTDHVRFTRDRGGTNASSANGSLTLNIWQHHVAVIPSDGTGAKMYLNGLDVTNGTGVGSGTANTTYGIGNQATATNRTFDGAMDEFRVYTRLLSAAEVRSLYLQPFLEFRTTKIYVNSVATAFTLAVDIGAYTLSGITSNLEYGRVLGAAVGSYSKSGTSANLEYGHVLVGAIGSYALSGIAASLESGRVLDAAVGSYSESGVAANLEYGHVVSAVGGSYALAGTAATLTFGEIESADLGSTVPGRWWWGDTQRH